MKSLDEKIEGISTEVDSLHESVSKENWNGLNKTGFIFELERSVKRLKEIFQDFSGVDREMAALLEKNSPDLSDFLGELGKGITVIESNLKMEKKAKWKENIINEHESFEMPELYSSMQERVLSLALKSRYSVERLRSFSGARSTHPTRKGSTAKNLLELLDKREREIGALKNRQAEMRRKSFLGFVEERNTAEIERDVNEMDKELSKSINDVKNALKIHMSQLEYLEGSFGQLREKVSEIDDKNYTFSGKALDLVKELKKERDYAKSVVLDVEKETMKLRGDYTKGLISMEETKQAIREKAMEKYAKEVESLRKELSEKTEELKRLKKNGQ